MLRRALLLAALVLLAGCTAREPAGEPSFLDDEGAPEGGSPTPPAARPTPPSASPTPSTTPATPTAPTSEPAPEPEENGTSSRPFEPEDSTAPCDSLEVRSPLTADPAGLTAGWPMLAIDIVLLADQAFVEAHPADWEALLRQLVADANLHYEEQLGLQLRIALVDRLPDGAIPPEATENDVRPVGRGWMLSQHPTVAYDVVAIILGADIAGAIAGQVDCVGGAYTPDTAYLWAEYAEPRQTPDDPLFEDTPLKVFMHETAHLFGAHHHYSDCGEALVELQQEALLGVCDVMINDVGLASTRFGPVNRLVVRSFVEEHQLGEPVG